MFIKKIYYFIPLILLIAISFSLMLYSSLDDSAIMDELAHIPAGYSYVRYLDYRLNPEHPPLLKMLSGLPLLFLQPNFPIDKDSWTKDINGQWVSGAQFLYESENDADQIIQLSRLAPILLTLILIFYIYIWSKGIMGRWWALVPAFLFALSPTVLAHGHYVTTDIAAAFGFFIALYYFIKYLFGSTSYLAPSLLNIYKDKKLILAGIAFGTAQLLKFSNIILIPILLILGFIYYLIFFREQGFLLSTKNTTLYTFKILLIFLIGFIFVYPFYYITTINYPVSRQKADTEFLLSSFAEGPDPLKQSCDPSSDVSPKRRIRCLAETTLYMTKNKVFRPYAQYLLGLLMVIQRGSGGNTIYFLGEVSSVGYWYYFPLVFLLKEPLPSLILIALGLLFATLRILKSGIRRKRIFNYLATNFTEFSMFLFIAIYWFISIRSPLNIGVRHILPTLPFIYILTTVSIRKWVSVNSLGGVSGFLKSLFSSFFKLGSIFLLLFLYLVNTFLISPHFLSFFNFFGGESGGYKIVTDSNFDWGQDLKRLKKFADENNIDKIAIDYFGGGSPRYYLDNKAINWWSSRGNPKEEGIEWLALSINTLQGAKGKLVRGQKRNSGDEYGWLKDAYNPYATAGKSIFIYNLR